MPRDGIEIGRSQQGVRRKRANTEMTTQAVSPASAPIGQDQGSDRDQWAMAASTSSAFTPADPPIADVGTPQRRRRATFGTTARKRSPSVESNGPSQSAGAGGEGRDDIDIQERHALPTPIEPAATPVRKRRARNSQTPTAGAPGVSSIGQGDSSDREQRTILTPEPSHESPAAPGIGHNSNAVAGGDGQVDPDTQVPLAISAIVKELVSLQNSRRFCIVQKNRSERAIESLIATTMGFRVDGTEKDRKAVFARAKTFRLAVEKGGEGHTNTDGHAASALSALVPLILISAENRKPWTDLRKKVEDDMKKKAKDLPVYDFAKSVKGLGPLGLACLTAEAGIPIDQYRTVSGLWKRMGLAVLDGRRQQKSRDKSEAARQGYSPRRRAEVWAFCSDSMFRKQWMGLKSVYLAEVKAHPEAEKSLEKLCKDKKVKESDLTIPDIETVAWAHDIDLSRLTARPAGPYGEVYGRRRERTVIRVIATESLDTKDPNKWTDARCHNDARRIMSKALLRDLWRVWKGLPPRKLEAA